MNNSNCGQLGAIQTRGTCWFYSILNGFILSQDGQKILYNRLKEYYSKLKPAEKAYFDDTINAPCPLKDITKTKEIYFWKFVDQYLCFMSGPREMSLKAGKSANLLGGMSLQGTVAKEAQGGKGAFPQMEIEKILDHIGFKGKYDIRYAVTKPVKFDGRKKPQFVVAMQDKGAHIKQYMNQIPAGFLNNTEYAPMCASIVIGNSEASNSEMHKWHAVAGYVCNGKGFIYDSNQKKIFRCDWWIRSEMVKTIKGPVADFYSFFKGGQITYTGYAFAVFARKEFTKNIGPSCLLKYKIKTPKIYGMNFTDPNLGRRLNSSEFNNVLKPAEIVALKRKWARTEHKAPVYINKATFNSIVDGAKNRNNGVRWVNNLEHAGYKFKHENYNNFAAKLKAKFPNKVVAPAKTYTFTNAKAHLNQFTKSTAAVRKHQYSLVWRGIPTMAQRKVLMHWRNKGEWLANNAFEEKAKPPIKRKPAPKTPSPSPRTKRATKVRSNFNTYWKGLQSNNRKVIRNYVAAYKSPNNNANAMNYMNFGTPSPVKKASPAKNSTPLAAAKRNVNAIKTAKKRKEYRRTRAVNMSQNNWTALVRYIDQKNAEARWARAAKKTVAK